MYIIQTVSLKINLIYFISYIRLISPNTRRAPEHGTGSYASADIRAMAVFRGLGSLKLQR